MSVQNNVSIVSKSSLAGVGRELGRVVRSTPRKIGVVTAVALGLASMTAESAFGQYSNDFTDSTTASQFVTDRANPGGFDINTTNPGDLTLRVRTADAPGQTDGFYNFHGIQTVGDFNAGYGSILSATLWVPLDWKNNAQRRTGDLWARINDQPLTQDNYPTIGIYHYAGTSVDDRTYIEMFAGTLGGFDGNPLTDDLLIALPAGGAINYDAYNTLALRLNDSGTLDFLFNDAVVGTILVGYTGGVAIRQAFLQGWQGSEDYDVRFGSLTVVPEMTTVTAVVVTSGITLLRRRRVC